MIETRRKSFAFHQDDLDWIKPPHPHHNHHGKKHQRKHENPPTVEISPDYFPFFLQICILVLKNVFGGWDSHTDLLV